MSFGLLAETFYELLDFWRWLDRLQRLVLLEGFGTVAGLGEGYREVVTGFEEFGVQAGGVFEMGDRFRERPGVLPRSMPRLFSASG